MLILKLNVPEAFCLSKPGQLVLSFKHVSIAHTQCGAFREQLAV